MYTWPLKELWLLCVGLVVVCLSQSHYLYSRRNLSSLLYVIEAVLGNKPSCAWMSSKQAIYECVYFMITVCRSIDNIVQHHRSGEICTWYICTGTYEQPESRFVRIFLLVAMDMRLQLYMYTRVRVGKDYLHRQCRTPRLVPRRV